MTNIIRSILCFLFLIGLSAGESLAQAKVSKEPIDPETRREVMLDLPLQEHLKNLPNGGGCCVWASLDMMSRWHDFKPMIGVLQDRLGGANASHVKKCFDRRAKGFTNYVQAEGSKTEEVLDWCFRTGRIPGVTYGFGERYVGSRNPSGRISHMVILLHLDKPTASNPRACVLDNNFPGTYEWMNREEFFRRHRLGGAWCVALIVPPPPPVPKN